MLQLKRTCVPERTHGSMPDSTGPFFTGSLSPVRLASSTTRPCVCGEKGQWRGVV